MSATTTPETPEVWEIIDRAMKLSPGAREYLARELVRSVHPQLDLSTFDSPTDLVDYLRTKPNAVIE